VGHLPFRLDSFEWLIDGMFFKVETPAALCELFMPATRLLAGQLGHGKCRRFGGRHREGISCMFVEHWEKGSGHISEKVWHKS
jgi:hypothetical protein